MCFIKMAKTGHIHEVSVGPNFDELVVAAHERLTKWTMQTEPPPLAENETLNEDSNASENADKD